MMAQERWKSKSSASSSTRLPSNAKSHKWTSSLRLWTRHAKVISLQRTSSASSVTRTKSCSLKSSLSPLTCYFPSALPFALGWIWLFRRLLRNSRRVPTRWAMKPSFKWSHSSWALSLSRMRGYPLRVSSTCMVVPPSEPILLKETLTDTYLSSSSWLTIASGRRSHARLMPSSPWINWRWLWASNKYHWSAS